MARHNEIGEIGEDIAAKWLVANGFKVIERNYLKKWGEIDIVTRGTDQNIHFVEVKSVSYETRQKLEYAVSHETWRPEENVHKNKIDRMKRAIQTWITENNHNAEFQIDIVTVRMVPGEKFAKVKLIEDVIFE